MQALEIIFSIASKLASVVESLLELAVDVASICCKGRLVGLFGVDSFFLKIRFLRRKKELYLLFAAEVQRTINKRNLQQRTFY